MAQAQVEIDPERIKVGPDREGGYRYSIDERLSVQYYNAASARAASRKPQRVNADGLLEPKV